MAIAKTIINTASFMKHICQSQFHVFYLTGLLVVYTQTAYADFPEGSAGLGSSSPHIPEPLLFDLVRPLGAKKGELEINTLGDFNTRNGEIEWAPEIEYAFADGMALELEFPGEHTRITDYKIALQGTLDYWFNNPNLIQGWQVIAKKNRDTKEFSTDALYINGYRINSHWSMLNMIGLRKSTLGDNDKLVTLMNNNLFYDVNSRITFGIELNHEIDRAGRWRYRYTPQTHIDINGKATLQAGFGVSRLNRDKRAEELISLRLIHAF